ncbi:MULTISPECIES: response regulator transcription factor [unclassified Leptotrichia]|uniref:response regulator transcription factor n=1 Tax=unclassified Leptotrichia TaxID=2633022 RepID=UPI001824AFA3|nr:MULTISPECIES: response regulator transcription factor [unclassified Leptotrichia]MBB1534967.1 response regulator transcription factor [Leptotrichia sp.]QUB96398.1 response regulator transcription factor [Leptotrichia sp. oral taxon 221]
MKMLVYNKNEKARAVVGRLLKELGFNVLLADTEKSLLEYLKTESLDIALLDIESMEDFRKSIDNILKYKKRSYFLIAIEETDRFSKTEALLKGIDDYIYNDFNLEELSAKVRAIIRVLNKRLTEDDMGLLTVYDLTLNPLNREVRRAGNEIELTNKEFLLLEYFLRNKNRVLTRSMISEKIWDIDFVTASNIVDVYINFLRAKIDKGFSKKIIKTVRSVGYIVKE